MTASQRLEGELLTPDGYPGHKPPCGMHEGGHLHKKSLSPKMTGFLFIFAGNPD